MCMRHEMVDSCTNLKNWSVLNASTGAKPVWFVVCSRLNSAFMELNGLRTTRIDEWARSHSVEKASVLASAAFSETCQNRGVGGGG